MTGDQASIDTQTRYMVKRKEEVLSIAGQYVDLLGLSTTLKDEFAAKFEFLWELFPVGSKYHSVPYFAEILVFHVLREKGLFKDPIMFCKISPLGDMPMFKRAWLLRYKKYLPRTTVQHPKLTPDIYLAVLFKNGVLDDDFKNACTQVKKIIFPRMKNNNPRMVAGVVCYSAYKSKPEQPISLLNALKTMGITSAGSVYNAAKRFKEYHGIDLDNLQLKTFKMKEQQALAEASS